MFMYIHAAVLPARPAKGRRGIYEKARLGAGFFVPGGATWTG